MFQTELHRHLDVSLRLSTLFELAQARGLEGSSTSLAAFRAKVVFEKPLASLHTMLNSLALFPAVLDRPESIVRVAREAVEDCAAEGTSWVEFRFSPGFMTEKSGMHWDALLDALEHGLGEGLAQCPGMRAGLICIATKEHGMDTVLRTVDFFLRHRARLLAIDLAGDELAFPNSLYEQALAPVRAAGLPITIHAGEAGGPENIWSALERLGARRIGHGITAERDPKLIDHLREKRICLEVCPISNWLTSSVPSLEAHPLPRLLRAGVPVSLNTDDPTVFGTSLPREIDVAKTRLGLSEAEVEACFAHARRASFLN